MFGANLHLFLFINSIYLFSCAYCEIPRLLLCADPQCSVPISEAQGKIFYTPNHEHGLAFKKGAKMRIMSKCKEKDGYWGAKIGNKSGFVPSTHVKEVTVWRSYDMLIYEVSNNLTITAESGKSGANINTDQGNLGTDSAGSKNGDPSRKVRSPLSNLLQGDISSMSGETEIRKKEIEQHENNSETENSNQGSATEINGDSEPKHVSSTNTPTDKPTLTEDETDGDINLDDSKDHDNDGDDEEDEEDDEDEDPDNNLSDNEDNLDDKSLGETPELSQFHSNDTVLESPNALESDVNKTFEEVKLPESEQTDTQSEQNELNQSSYENPDVNHLRKDSKENVIDSPNVEQYAPNVQNNSDIINETNADGSNTEIEMNDSQLNIPVKSLPNSAVLNHDQDESVSLSSSAPEVDGENITSTSSTNHSETGINEAKDQEQFEASLIGQSEGIKNDLDLESSKGTTAHEISSNVVQGTNIKEKIISENPANVDSLGSVSTVSISDSSSSSGSSISSTNSSSGSDSNLSTEVPASVVNSGKESGSPVDTFQRSSVASDSQSLPAWGSPGQFGQVERPELPERVLDKAPGSGDSWPHGSSSSGVRDSRNMGQPYDSGLGSSGSAYPNVELTAPHAMVSDVQEGSTLSVETKRGNDDTRASYVQSMQPSKQNEKINDIPVVHGKVTEDTENNEANSEVGSHNHITRLPEQNEKSSEVKQTPEQNEELSSGININLGPTAQHIETTVLFQNVPSTTENPKERTPSETEPSNSVPESTPLGLKDGDVVKETEESVFTRITENVLGWIGLGSKTSEEEVEIPESQITEEVLANEPTLGSQGTIVRGEGICYAPDGLEMKCEGQSAVEDEPYAVWNFWTDSKPATVAPSYNTVIYLVVTAVTVLLFTLGYYFIEKFRSDGPLIAKVNKLEQELQVSWKECLLLKDELVSTKEKLNLFETSSNDKIITALQLELEESKKVRSELENSIEVLQQELDAATEAGLDLNRMLSEVLTQKGGSESLMESVEHLQSQLNNQQKIIDETTTKLIAKSKENQELQSELTAAAERIESLEGEIEDIRGNLNVHLKDNEDVIGDLTAKNNELQIKIGQLNEAREKEISKLKKNAMEFERKLKATADSLKIKEEEYNNLKESVKKIKMKDSKSIDSLLDVSRIKAELSQCESENKSLKERMKVADEKQSMLEAKSKQMDEEIEKLKQISADAEREKTEAQTRLEVLSNYFKEKETQLQKELGLREAMWVQKQGDDSTIYERMKSLEEEISSYKSQNEALKKEILDQERGLKAQITTLEKKAHENWIVARQAERKLEESKQEAGQLRNKLTLMEKNLTNELDSSQHRRVEEPNGGDTLSPLIHDTSSPILFPPPIPLDPNNSSLIPPGFIPPPMFMPPPPGGFMPPPPPFLPGDHRPPPLGRMSSPPLNNRFSPPPSDYPYDRMSTPPLSPSSRDYRSPNEAERDRERFRHRTPTSPSFRSRNWEEGPSVGMTGFRPISSERDSRREHKGGSNLSSGHSSDSLDKSSRHSGRV